MEILEVLVGMSSVLAIFGFTGFAGEVLSFGEKKELVYRLDHTDFTFEDKFIPEKNDSKNEKKYEKEPKKPKKLMP